MSKEQSKEITEARMLNKRSVQRVWSGVRQQRVTSGETVKPQERPERPNATGQPARDTPSG